MRHRSPLLALAALTLWASLLIQACALTPPSPSDLPTQPPDAPTQILPAPTDVAEQTVPTSAAAQEPPPALPDCAFEQGLAPQVASYCMSVRLNPKTKTVAGVERITYRNPSQDTLSELWLHLYLRAFRDTRTLWMRETGGQLPHPGSGDH